MELWIRSQDKEELRPQPKLGIDEVDNLFYIVDRYDLRKASILGKYKSKERALEVLDEIQKLLDGRWIKEKAQRISMQDIFPIIFYEMPEE